MRGALRLDCGYVREVYAADVAQAVSSAYPRHPRRVRVYRRGTNTAGFRTSSFPCKMRYRTGQAYGHPVLRYRAVCTNRAGDSLTFSSSVA